MTADCTGKSINMKAETINFEATTINSKAETIDSEATTINSKASDFKVQATSDFDGTIHCNNNITSDTDVIASGISSVNHTHPYSWTAADGSGNTGKPS